MESQRTRKTKTLKWENKVGGISWNFKTEYRAIIISTCGVTDQSTDKINKDEKWIQWREVIHFNK